jgi:hypothetical protein
MKILLPMLKYILIRFLIYGVLHHFQQYFSYIVAVSFISGGNRSTWKKTHTCSKSLISNKKKTDWCLTPTFAIFQLYCGDFF